MVMFTSEIPAVWWLGAATVWTVAAFVLTFRGGWFCMPDRSEAFPFSARQFFLMALAVMAAFFLYISSYAFADSLVSSFRQTPAAASLGSLSSHEWLAFTQIAGLFVGTIAISLVSYVLPSDLQALVSGKSSGFKKWAKGAGFGILFVPVILLTTWIVGVLTSIVGPSEKAPQIALDILARLPRESPIFWCMILVVVVVVPYVEEMLFRGFLQGFLNGLVHPTLSVLLTSAAFAFFHYSPEQKGSNLEIIAGLLVFSIFASKLRVNEDAIAAPMGMHAAFNAVSLFLFFRTT